MRSMVEGLVGQNARHNEGNYGRHIIENGASRYSKHPNAFTRKPGIANLVLGRLVASPMRLAIDFDRQLRARAEEVEHIDARWMLMAKFEASRSRT